MTLIIRTFALFAKPVVQIGKNQHSIVGGGLSAFLHPTSRLRQCSVLVHTNNTNNNENKIDSNGRSPTFLIFGSNTDIGKTVLSAALVRAAAASISKTTTTTSEKELIATAAPNNNVAADDDDIVAVRMDRNRKRTTTHYIKPLQCGGSDEAFLRKHVPTDNLTSAKTLFRWETPASPHTASRIENFPISDEQVLKTLIDYIEGLTTTSTRPLQQRTDLNDHDQRYDEEWVSTESTFALVPDSSSIWIETAGGVLSPSSSSPHNNQRYHAKNSTGWGWVPQADLYMPLREVVSVILIGDGRLGGISATLSSLEALVTRGYNVSGILMIRPDGEEKNQHTTNREALIEYARSVASSMNAPTCPIFHNPEASILNFPALPPEPEPLMEWYTSPEVVGLTHFVRDHLFRTWR
jgi:dethiobiotin synthetase/adenosylmethionine--8-amino-7-oxononanoate aminotransferase